MKVSTKIHKINAKPEYAEVAQFWSHLSLSIKTFLNVSVAVTAQRGWFSAHGMATSFLEGRGKRWAANRKKWPSPHFPVQESRKVTLSPWCCHSIGWPVPAAVDFPAPFGAGRQIWGSTVFHHLFDFFPLFTGLGLKPYTWEAATQATFTSSVLQDLQMPQGWLWVWWRQLEKIIKMPRSSYIAFAVDGIFGI